MKIHMSTVHLKKKPYKCDLCPKSFGGKRPLKIHRQTVHFKQRPLQCLFCDKRFGQRSNLNVHMKVHRRGGDGGGCGVGAASPPHSPVVSSSVEELAGVAAAVGQLDASPLSSASAQAMAAVDAVDAFGVGAGFVEARGTVNGSPV